MYTRKYVAFFCTSVFLIACYIHVHIYLSTDYTEGKDVQHSLSQHQQWNFTKQNNLSSNNLKGKDNENQRRLETRTLALPKNLTDSDLKYLNSKYYLRGPNPIGRLGNHMFQFAATLGIADTLKYNPIIGPSHPLLKSFNIKPILISDINLANVLIINEDRWKNVTWRKSEKYTNHNLTVGGFFQSWKYFANISVLIREVFSIKPEFIEKARLFLKSDISESKTKIGIHVRRGDMLTSGSKKLGRLVADRNYISKAMEFFRKRYKNSHFVVCSDDMKWSKENINSSDVTFSVFKEPIIDLAIMSMCSHTIITVGSFGWWSGWLAGGTVVYLSDFPLPGSDLDKYQPKESYYPPEWVGIRNGV